MKRNYRLIKDFDAELKEIFMTCWEYKERGLSSPPIASLEFYMNMLVDSLISYQEAGGKRYIDDRYLSVQEAATYLDIAESLGLHTYILKSTAERVNRWKR